MSTVIALHPRTGRQHLARPARPVLELVKPEGRELAPTSRQRTPLEPTRLEPTPLGAGPLRLTRRGRFVVQALVTMLLLVAVAAAVLLLTKPAQAGSSVQPVPLGYHVVLPGETLWQIAGEVAPGTDRRNTIDGLMELNALSTSAVSVGQRIAYPLASARP